MTIFHLPDLGEGLAEAEIREWYVKVGDVVAVDQPIVSMETAKAVVDVPSPHAGKIKTLHGKVNEVIKTHAPLVTFEGEDKGSVVGQLETSSKKWDEGEVKIGATPSATASLKVMPAARALAKEMQVDLATVTATGPQHTITVDDVKKAMSNSSETLHGVRRVMAQAMEQSHHQIVPVTIMDEVDISHLASDADVSVLLLQAIVAGVKAVPVMNAWFDGKTLKRQVISEVNVGLAVDTPEGLFVPVIKQVEQQSSSALREVINGYKQSVRDRKVAPADLQGATITLSNFGMIAGYYATPIIVPPMVAILGCGRRRNAPVVHDGKITVGVMLPLSLTFDHRAVTGGEATRFLAAVMGSLTGI